jgi:Tfp pilus assembly pilus retraction ATPase PilT
VGTKKKMQQPLSITEEGYTGSTLKVVLVCGNIGSGKSICLSKLDPGVLEVSAQYQHVIRIPEPVEEWEFALKRAYTRNDAESLVLLQQAVLNHYHQVHQKLLKLKDRCALDHKSRLVVIERREPL